MIQAGKLYLQHNTPQKPHKYSHLPHTTPQTGWQADWQAAWQSGLPAGWEAWQTGLEAACQLWQAWVSKLAGKMAARLPQTARLAAATSAKEGDELFFEKCDAWLTHCAGTTSKFF